MVRIGMGSDIGPSATPTDTSAGLAMNTSTHAAATPADLHLAPSAAGREVEPAAGCSFGEPDCLGYEALHPLTWLPVVAPGRSCAD